MACAEARSESSILERIISKKSDSRECTCFWVPVFPAFRSLKLHRQTHRLNLKGDQHDMSTVLRLPRKMQRLGKSIAPAVENDFRHVTKHVHTSRSATPARRNEVMRRWKHQKMTHFVDITMGTELRRHAECKRRGTTTNDDTTHGRRTQVQPPDPQL